MLTVSWIGLLDLALKKPVINHPCFTDSCGSGEALQNIKQFFCYVHSNSLENFPVPVSAAKQKKAGAGYLSDIRRPGCLDETQ